MRKKEKKITPARKKFHEIDLPLYDLYVKPLTVQNIYRNNGDSTIP